MEIPQIREAAEPFVSKLFPRGAKLLRTEPLKAMVIGAFVRGLSMRDIESLCEKAGLGKLSKSTASRATEGGLLHHIPKRQLRPFRGRHALTDVSGSSAVARL